MSSFYDALSASLSRLRARNLPAVRVMGLMSGTSLDGVDACLATVEVTETGVAVGDLVHYSAEMPWHLKEPLLALQSGEPCSLEALAQLNKKLGHLFADVALQALEEADEAPEIIFSLASHGLTVFHGPPKGPFDGTTLQIGTPDIIAQKTGIPVVADFRPRDMAVGGQGAPLVPFADVLLFQNDSRPCAVQNIGGIGNVTVLPCWGAGDPIAFDTGPGNMLIDGAVSLLFGRPFDPFGGIASAGQVHDPLMTLLQAHPFLQKRPPRSTGREAFGQSYLEPLLTQFSHLPKEDVLATLTDFTAWSIADAYQQYVLPSIAIEEVIVSGGGVHNRTLMKALKHRLNGVSQQLGLAKRIEVVTTDAYGIPTQAKEALAFALMGWANRLGVPNHVPSCTGAKSLTILGHQLPVLSLPSI